MVALKAKSSLGCLLLEMETYSTGTILEQLLDGGRAINVKINANIVFCLRDEHALYMPCAYPNLLEREYTVID